MKISDNRQVLSLTFKRHDNDSAKLFGDLKVGEKISASIISERGSSAVLEINGRRLTADFTGGVPKGSSVDLILTEKTADRIVFSTAVRQTADELVKLLSPLSILPDSRTSDIQLHNLVKFINTAKPDLFMLNLFLAGITKDDKPGRSKTELFNTLIAGGISFPTLADLSFLTGGRAGEILYFMYYSLLKNDRKKPFSKDEVETEKNIGSIISELSGDEEAFVEIAALFLDAPAEKKVYGEIPFPDNGKFARLGYIALNDSYFFDIELTALGKISAVIKADKFGIIINFFSDNNDSINFLKSRTEILLKNLELMDVKIQVLEFYNLKKMIDKIEKWCTDFYIKRDFDVKI